MLMLHHGQSLSYVAKTLCAARSSISRWIHWFTLFGIEGLKNLPTGRQKKGPVKVMLRMLDLLVQRSPQDFGYLRSRWSTEMLTIEINNLFHSSLYPGRFAVGFRVLGLSGAGRLPRCIFAILTKRKNWQRLVKR
jgi:transposase